MGAMEIRQLYLSLQGLSQKEIKEYCDPIRYPANWVEEMKELEAMYKIMAMNARQKMGYNPSRSNGPCIDLSQI